jgi:ATP-binding cassette subfamily F protein 3
MAPAEATVRSACSSLLAGIDEDVMEYIVEMFINGDDMGEPLVEALKEFILSYEFCPDEESSEAKARELVAAIIPPAGAVGGAGDRRASGRGEPKLLQESVTLAKVGGELFKRPEEYELGGRLVGIEEAMEDRKKRKAAREEERRATRRMYDKVAAQRARDDELLTAARVAAVRLRRERGAYLGAVEAKPFSMPNPGGGPDLLENASFTLQRGRRYGLIGRNG